VDPVAYGSYTGKISPYLVKSMGAFGTLLNHAENSLGDQDLEDSIKRSQDAELFTIVCANTPEYAHKVKGWAPDLIAVEPPELIGGDVSVSKAEPKIIEDSVAFVGEGRTLVGAGVKNSEDVKIAIALGASGVLLASGITKSEDPYNSLMDLVSGLQ
ncbi:triose-phosphate isomerase, partial [Candidatus Peregrinibacteria bacterium]|nr:triose-phosphate isomerase [Candidatus Peregrinibacteria bacterium]